MPHKGIIWRGSTQSE